MFTKGFGELLTDILTVNPYLRTISSASAILDASNYTFQAMTFGKDAEGYKHHAHTILSESSGVYNSGVLAVVVYNTTSPSSYHSSATKAQLSASYNYLPNYPNITDTRLERGSTVTNISSTPNWGHYVNYACSPVSSTSSLWNVVGGFAPSANQTYYLLSSNGSLITSGTLSGGFFNQYGLMDIDGFLKFTGQTATEIEGSDPDDPSIWSTGAVVTASGLSQGMVEVKVALHRADAACIAAFGGLNHIGIWCFDMDQMLQQGLNPPYSWNHLNTNRKYKLVGKVSFWDDLMYHQDNGSSPGFYTYLIDGQNSIHPGNEGPEYILNIKLS